MAKKDFKAVATLTERFVATLTLFGRFSQLVRANKVIIGPSRQATRAEGGPERLRFVATAQ